MKDIILSALILSVLSIVARTVLPKIQIFVKWIIKILVKYAEKRIKGSGLGKKKKAKVLKWLKWIGIHSSLLIDELIENAVDVMNNKKTEVKDEMVYTVKDKLESATDDVINRIK